MAENIESLTLTYLRRIDEKVDRLANDMREVKERLGILEEQYATLERQYASVSRRLDTLDQRVERIERRLDLIPTP
jgi:chromosome segregation ATPase